MTHAGKSIRKKVAVVQSGQHMDPETADTIMLLNQGNGKFLQEGGCR